MQKITGISLLGNNNTEKFNAHLEIDGKGLYKEDIDLKNKRIFV